VPPALWEKNDKFTQKLVSDMVKHPMSSHPIIDFFKNETMSTKATLKFHLEFGYAFAQVFTDAVLHAMARASELEPRLGPRGKVTARFLWALNLVDELGYTPSKNGKQYAGNPYAAHYIQFVKMFTDLGSNEKAILDYQPSKEAISARATFVEYFNDYQLLTTVLAYAESIFDEYASSWAYNVGRSTNVDVSTGYHTIHVKNEEGVSIDDDHSEDSWTLVRQAVVPERHQEIEDKGRAWLDNWYRFADNAMKIALE
jgi:hypothetical protein